MVRRGREEAPIAALLRVALGALWVYDGLVFKLLALNFGLTPGPAVSPVLALSRLAQLRLEGGLEVVVGLLLLGGRLVRLPAAAQCLLLSLLTGFSLGCNSYINTIRLGICCYRRIVATNNQSQSLFDCGLP